MLYVGDVLDYTAFHKCLFWKFMVKLAVYQYHKSTKSNPSYLMLCVSLENKSQYTEDTSPFSMHYSKSFIHGR